MMFSDLITEITTPRKLARAISVVENEVPGYEAFLQQLPTNNTASVIGITGPPGAGKSTLTDALIETYINQNNRVAVICVDPSSPFNSGALLGDRIRMGEWYKNKNVFIRSLATRGSLGGLSEKIIEVVDVIKAAGFNKIIIETVGVGQSEIDIARLADVTVVVLVPEGGDDVQSMKSGLMEIADIFVVNKSDRPGADTFVKNLTMMTAPAFRMSVHELPIVKTVATKKEGISDLMQKIEYKISTSDNERKLMLLVEKAYRLIQEKKMKSISKGDLSEKISQQQSNFNLYKFVAENY
ncbi:hypothetical protein BH09BAC2_BH09BAC2_04120 [soil metagenome]